MSAKLTCDPYNELVGVPINNQHTISIQSGYNRDTIGIQSGYNRDIIRCLFHLSSFFFREIERLIIIQGNQRFPFNPSLPYFICDTSYMWPAIMKSSETTPKLTCDPYNKPHIFEWIWGKSQIFLSSFIFYFFIIYFLFFHHLFSIFSSFIFHFFFIYFLFFHHLFSIFSSFIFYFFIIYFLFFHHLFSIFSSFWINCLLSIF